MGKFMSHITSLSITRTAKDRLEHGSRPSSAFPHAGFIPTKGDVMTIMQRGVTYSLPLDLMVSDAGERRNNKFVTCHVAYDTYPQGSFIKVSEGMYVSSPELCFLQLAEIHDEIDLVLLGNELCGTFVLPGPQEGDPGTLTVALDGSCSMVNETGAVFHYKSLEEAVEANWNARSGMKSTEGATSFASNESRDSRTPLRPSTRRQGFLLRPEPITSVARIARYIGKCDGMRGVKRARRALRYMVDDAASPMESCLAVRLVLPNVLGGYNLPKMEMNREIVVPDGVGDRPGKSYRVCDLLWPQQRVAVEYDSTAHHVGAARIARDSARRGELKYAGIDVATITAPQFFDFAAFDGQVRMIEKLLGHRRASRAKDVEQRRRELHRRIVSYVRNGL